MIKSAYLTHLRYSTLPLLFAGWGGPGATLKAAITLVSVSLSSWGYFFFKEVIESPEEVFVEEEEIVVRPVTMRRMK